jgi:hypothetical protein
MIAITTNSSTNVKPRRVVRIDMGNSFLIRAAGSAGDSDDEEFIDLKDVPRMRSVRVFAKPHKLNFI